MSDSANSSSFSLLDERIQHFIWNEGWESLRDAQELAIPHILGAQRDVIVAAATAAGKTEAAFLPALTYLLKDDSRKLIVYISPLKALINDQFGRLENLCERLEIPVWPWHGDVPASKKAKFLASPSGVLLITPESLEANLCNRGTAVKRVFGHLAFLVVDELHAFIGSERGKQLQSQLHRIERVIGRIVPRIGLSATLGDMSLAADYLRPGSGQEVVLVESKSAGSTLKILVKGYEEPLVLSSSLDSDDEVETTSPALIAHHLYEALRGSNNLVFPNSRREVERYTHLLNKLCETNRVPNEFWPHHGNLSKEIRTETESALKQKEVPATAICTNTLELGIDIGAVKSVAQIGPPHSVASMRQRLGRSGRRKGEPAILRGYCIEHAVAENSSLGEELRLDCIQMTAMISLLLEGWFEPPRSQGTHFSTLVQQVLSVIAQYGGVSIATLYTLLCGPNAPFNTVTKEEFIQLIRHLGRKEILVQDSGGTLLHGALGEKLVNHYTFYAAFSVDEEFRIVCGAKVLGTLPVTDALLPEQRILFAGRTWKVESVDEEQKTIYVVRTHGGVPPSFSGKGGGTHTVIRARMRDILEGIDVPPYLDVTARRFLTEARACYERFNLRQQMFINQGTATLMVTWLGDSANQSIALLLRQKGYTANPSGLGVEIVNEDFEITDIIDTLIDCYKDELPSLEELLHNAANIHLEKWDWALPDRLLFRNYDSQNLSTAEALMWINKTFITGTRDT